MKGSDRLQLLSESQTIALTKKVREMQAKGIDVLGLTLGEPDMDTPDHIRKAAIRAIEAGHTHYPPVPGIPELRQAIAESFKRNNGLDYEAKNIVVSTGAKQSLINIMLSMVNPGDEVILIAPYWVSYYDMVSLSEGKQVVIQTTLENNFKVSPAQLEAAITPKTKMVLFNSPSNPSGAMYSHSEMKALVEVLERHLQVYILSDEIYEHICYEEKHISFGSFPEIFDRTITVNGVSKGFAMTGWRLGYIGAPLWIAQLSEKIQGQFTSGACTISQYAALEAVSGDMKPTYAMRDEFRKRRDAMYLSLSQIKGIQCQKPEGAFYFYPNVAHYFGMKTENGEIIRDVDHFCEYLIEEAKVAVIPGSAFGTDHHIRISYAYAQPVLLDAMTRIKDSLEKLI